MLKKSWDLVICLRFTNRLNVNLNLLRSFSSNLSIDVPKLTEKDLTPVESINSDENEIQKVGDINHRLRLSRYNRRHDVEFYQRLIINAASEGNKEKMLELFFHDMLLVDRVKPTILLINILLKSLANLGGHSEAAFKILAKTKEIRMNPTPSTYSLVFKNCSKEIANNDFFYDLPDKSIKLLSEDELKKVQAPALKALSIWQNLQEKDMGLLGEIGTVNSLMLTLARAGLMRECFSLLDDFLNAGRIKPTDFTLAAVLEACLWDRDNGFGLGLIIFHKMLHQHKCMLSCYAMSNMLKLVRKCQLGNSLTVNEVVKASSYRSLSLLKTHDLTLSLPGKSQEPVSSNLDVVATETSLGPVISQYPQPIHFCDSTYGSVIKESGDKYQLKLDNFIESHWSNFDSTVFSIKSPTNFLQKVFTNVFDNRWLETRLEPSSKLACIGGVMGVIGFIQQYNLQPNIVILTDLVSCLPYRVISDPNYPLQDLSTVIVKAICNTLKITPDNSFKNSLYKRQFSKGVEENFAVISQTQFDPYTWSCYSKKCKITDDVKKFLHLMESSQVVPNNEIFYSLLRSVDTWGARMFVLLKMRKRKIKLDRSTIVHIENEIKKVRLRIESMSEEEKKQNNIALFYNFEKLYSKRLDKTTIEPITTGDRKIFIDDLPKAFQRR